MPLTFARRISGLAALAVVALLVAACGSSGSSSTGSGSAAAGGASPTTASSTAKAMLAAAKGSLGTYLTDGSGRALYLWVADANGNSACSGACAQAWPPLITKGKPAVSGSVVAGDLGTTKRSDGSLQVTYKGHPLYYFIGDNGAGKTTGQGSDGFGAKWWLVGPTGAAITKVAASGGTPSGAY